MSRKRVVDRDLLYDLYVIKGYSFKKVREELKIGSATLKRVMDEHGINRDSRQENYKISKTQKDLIIGSNLGDGSFSLVRNNKCSLMIAHAENQKKYCEEKLKILKSLVKHNSLKLRLREEDNDAKRMNQFLFYTLHLSELIKYKEMTIKECIDNLNKNSLTIWFLDDGHTIKKNKEKNVSQYSEISCCRFTDEEVKHLLNVLKEKFGLIAKVKKGSQKDKNGHHGIYFNVENSKYLTDLILDSDFSQIALSSMKYKLIFRDDF